MVRVPPALNTRGFLADLCELMRRHGHRVASDGRYSGAGVVVFTADLAEKERHCCASVAMMRKPDRLESATGLGAVRSRRQTYRTPPAE